jgi:anti-sigma-K factor RskA
MSGAENDRDLLAAEYVLGVLEGAERDEVIRRADRDNALSAAIAEWEERLAPLGTIVPPVAAPAVLWQRIETSCGLMAAPLSPETEPARAVKASGFWDALGFWRGATALGFGLAAAIAVVAVINRPPTPSPAAPPEIPLASAVLASPKAGEAPAFVAEANADKTIMLKPLERVAIASGKDLELWALPDGATVPQPLGVIGAAGQTVALPPSLHGPGQLMVSLEQKGGSSTGLPQGPVLWLGHISQLD